MNLLQFIHILSFYKMETGIFFLSKSNSEKHVLVLMCWIVKYLTKESITNADLSNAALLNICWFHWHLYQYRNKIPLKQENTAMLYQLETFTTKILHVQPQNMMPGKIYFHIIFFSYSVLFTYNKKALGKKNLKYWNNISQMCKNITWTGLVWP